MLRDPLDIVWCCADNPNPALVAEELAAIPRRVLDRLLELGLVKQAATATHVTCDACADYHVEEVTRVAYPGGEIRFFITCPHNGRVEVPRERLLQWSVDYLPVLRALASTLSVRDALGEVIPGRIWSLGRAPLAGKSKIVWAARGLAWPDAARVAAALPKGRSPVLFFLGQAPDEGLLGIPRESIIELRTIVGLDDDLAIDRDAVEIQLSDTADGPAKKQTKKRSPRDATIGALKRELHERILSMKSAVLHADNTSMPFEPPRLLQKDLAIAIKVSESSVSRAIRESDDLELKIMLQTVENEGMIRKYSR